MAVVNECLENNIKWQNEYGEKTIVLTAVGSFFENYSLVDDDGSYISNVFQEFITVCDLMAGKRNMFIDGKQVAMAGFPVQHLEKHVNKLQEHNYTIVIYKQDVNGKNTTRSLAEIISPGTFFSNETPELSNNVMCIWLHKSNTSKYFSKQVTIGVANIDIFTGKTTLFQFNVECNNNPLTFDELERYVSAYKPNECLIVSNSAGNSAGSRTVTINSDKITGGVAPRPPTASGIASLDDIISFIGLDNCRKVHKINIDKQTSQEKSKIIKCVLNSEKQNYQKDVLRRFYPDITDTQVMEYFSIHSIATQAFCFLLDFVYQHSPNLVRKLHTPIYENHTDKLVLANHSLRQLNITDDSRHTGKNRSVSSLLNNCVTTMGKRSFMYNLYNPTTKIDTLNDSYFITDHLLNQEKANKNSWQTIRKELSTIKDIEKMRRKLILGKIVPKDFACLAYDLRRIADLFASLKGDTTLTAYIQKYTQNSDNIDKLCTDVIADIERTLCIDKCFKVDDLQLVDVESDTLVFINKGISSMIDSLSEDTVESREKLEAIRIYFSDIIKLKEKVSTRVKETEYIKIHETPKSDAVLMGTSRRVTLLKSEMKRVSEPSIHVKYMTRQQTFELSIQDLSYETVGSNKKDLIITNTQIKSIASNVQNSKDKLIQELLLVFNAYVADFTIRFEQHFEHIKKYISLLDLLQCKCYIAHTYNYCRPANPTAIPSVAHALAVGAIPLAVGATDGIAHGIADGIAPFINFTGIRHPLIEHIQKNELYVTNDLHIGGALLDSNINSSGGVAPSNPTASGIEGILLFGTNAVGKTSFIKSVGIALIMAQAGLYVPCSTFIYKPYSYIFTRILGNDNLFKGLSTFAVEMSELRTIITQADERSLVLGDELCSGTESDSALSIFTAGLEHLHEKKSTFLFATHFHEIVEFDEIKALTRLKMKHMTVKYDLEHDTLIYDRKLQDGPGDSMYGLEVCKSLNLPDKFLQRAHDIRMKYNTSKKNILALSSSHFNAQKIVSNCEICKNEKASEVHHLQHQKYAKNSNNYIDSFHKNHLANLLNICKACHKKIHSTTHQHAVKKTIEGTYILVRV